MAYRQGPATGGCLEGAQGASCVGPGAQNCQGLRLMHWTLEWCWPSLDRMGIAKQALSPVKHSGAQPRPASWKGLPWVGDLSGPEIQSPPYSTSKRNVRSVGHGLPYMTGNVRKNQKIPPFLKGKTKRGCIFIPAGQRRPGVVLYSLSKRQPAAGSTYPPSTYTVHIYHTNDTYIPPISTIQRYPYTYTPYISEEIP